MADLSHATKSAAPKTAAPESKPSAADHEHGLEGPVGAPGLDGAALAGAADGAPIGSAGDGLISRQAALLSNGRLGAQRVRLLQRMQSGYGNGHVSRVIHRFVAEAPAKEPIAPEQDPKFKAVTGKIGQVAHKEKEHAPAKSKVAEAQKAAVPPANEVASQASAAQVDKMDKQKPGEFDKAAFIAAVKKAIEAASPKNLEEADDFKKSGKAGEVKGQVSGMVTKGKEGSEKAIKDTTKEAPDTSAAKPKPVAPMGDEKPGAAPQDVGAKQAIPDAKSGGEVSMDQGPADVNKQMTDAKVTDEQLKNSNEPQFQDASEAKKTAEVDSKQAPQAYRAEEQQTLGKAGAEASATTQGQLAGMHASKTAVVGAITGNKGGAKSKDEGKRAEVSAKIEGIFTQTKTEVMAILDGLDAKVNTAFESGEAQARSQFESYVDQKMTAYKNDRYSGWTGGLKWAKDKLFGMPSEVNVFYSQGRDLYLKQMDTVISRVADVVGGELGRAKARIAQGKAQVKEYVASQPKELQKIAQEAEKNIGGKFDELEGEVNSKQDGLVQTLADKYVAARDALDSRINELKEANKGLVNKVIDAVAGVIKTILALKDMLLGVLAKAASVIETIISDPIKFLGNLVGAIKMGLNQFVANIGTHLKKALMGWLFGTLGDAGLQLPDSFDLKGILSIILQVLGLTYENVRAIAVKLVGEKVVGLLEGTVKVLVTLAKEGPAGLWTWIKDKIAEIDIKGMVIGAIKDFVITKIITAGVTWLISMLNPAAAFIKACKMIYDVIMFFIERGSQIMEFVNSILDGISAIASGSLGAAANLVENSLSKILPLAISFLASLLGVGGIAEKIKDIIEKIRAPITKLIGAVLGPILKPLKKLANKGMKFVKGLADKGKAALKKGVDKIKGKIKNKFYGGTDADKEKRLEAGLAEGKSAVSKYSGKSVGKAVLTPLLFAIRMRHRLTVLRPVEQGDNWGIEGQVQRKVVRTDVKTEKGEVNLNGKLDPEKLRRWRGSTKQKLMERFPASHRNDGTLLAELDRRHIVAVDRLVEWAISNIHGQKFAVARQKLAGHAPAKDHNTAFIAATKKWIRDKANDQDNIWVGAAKKNRQLGAQIPKLKAQLAEAKTEKERKRIMKLLNEARYDENPRKATPKSLKDLMKDD